MYTEITEVNLSAFCQQTISWRFLFTGRDLEERHICHSNDIIFHGRRGYLFYNMLSYISDVVNMFHKNCVLFYRLSYSSDFQSYSTAD